MTDCARSVGDNTRAGGEYLEPVSVEDAVAFLASHGGTEVVLEHFAEQGLCAPGRKVVLVGHCIGGLVLRELLRHADFKNTRT